MKYFNYLKKNFPLYIASSIILGVSVFLLITISRFNNNLQTMLKDTQDMIYINGKIMEQIKQTDSLTKYVSDNFGVDMSSANSEKPIFRVLDDMKSNLTDASITVQNFEKNGDSIRLHVTIRAPMKSYRMILDYATYLESFRLPDYEISAISISDAQAGKIVLIINGALVMPSPEART